MTPALILAQVLSAISICWAQSPKPPARIEAEYYVAAYAQHYRVPVPLVRAIVERESSWQPCVVSPKGAAGLMQLMPVTARRLGVRNRCNLDQNISGGVRYLAWLMRKFQNDLRLVAAAYYAGEDVIGRRDLGYRNPDVIAYVARIRTTYLRETEIKSPPQEVLRIHTANVCHPKRKKRCHRQNAECDNECVHDCQIAYWTA